MSFIKYEYIGINKYSRPGIKNNGIKGLIMHYTANNGGTARNHKSYFNNLSGSYASAQLFVDDTEALCIIPLDEVAYHANDIQKYVNGQPYYPLRSIIGNANYSTIGLEMCLDSKGNITEATFQNSVKAVKELIKMYPQITADRIWRHYDVTGKNCPAPWVAKPSELDRFKKAVFSQSSTPAPEKPNQKKKVGNVMLLFQEKGKVYWLVGNKYTYVEGPKHLEAIKLAMDKAGYDTWVHTNATQIKYFKKIAELVK
ncbi:peptidoglycan recognition protein family protein [Enterococcus asini]|uniref:peptidoglycan recognition protein family protein n=1 Tax=Enterococcus asini TaxID=57732 RepID=UPI001E3F1F9F|nr:N-acetylmuramoyl-L-alanine amidase [Enterococcus asini]MCD5030375.1 N-acetylmuramoyl-L-alanine amidase [Enterococcus asini]